MAHDDDDESVGDGRFGLNRIISGNSFLSYHSLSLFLFLCSSWLPPKIILTFPLWWEVTHLRARNQLKVTFQPPDEAEGYPECERKIWNGKNRGKDREKSVRHHSFYFLLFFNNWKCKKYNGNEKKENEERTCFSWLAFAATSACSCPLVFFVWANFEGLRSHGPWKDWFLDLGGTASRASPDVAQFGSESVLTIGHWSKKVSSSKKTTEELEEERFRILITSQKTHLPKPNVEQLKVFSLSLSLRWNKITLQWVQFSKERQDSSLRWWAPQMLWERKKKESSNCQAKDGTWAMVFEQC